MPSVPRVAFINCGGSISAVGHDSLDLIEYADGSDYLAAAQLLQRYPEISSVVDVVDIPVPRISSAAVGLADWLSLVQLICEAVAADPEIKGVVIAHGTATLEETAYFLNLTMTGPTPVVLVGAQRPPTALGTDAGMNLFNAFRVAVSPDAVGAGVLVVMNDEIHHSRDVTKTSTFRLQTFRSLDFGMLGQVDADGVRFYRAGLRAGAAFAVGDLTSIPRVDVCYSYVGADGAAIDAFASAGAAGIVSAGFAPGLITPQEMSAAMRAIGKGVVFVQCSRAGWGRVASRRRLRERGIVAADNLSPQKARILLMLALTRSRDPAEIQGYFDKY